MLTAPSVPDMTIVANGSTHDSLTAAQVSAKYGAGNIKTATKDFSVVYRGQHLTFKKAVPVVCDAALIAYLASVGAPVT